MGGRGGSSAKQRNKHITTITNDDDDDDDAVADDMGNTGSSSGRPHHDDTVDYGSLSPHGVYTGPRDWNHPIVTQLIIDRKLAPFYRPLEDYNDDWDDDQILAARKDFPDTESAISDTPAARSDPKPSPAPKRTSALKDPSRCPEATLYRGAVECPICFLVRYLLPSSPLLHQSLTLTPVLPPQHQPLPLLRSSNLHRMFRADQENRTYRNTSRFRTRRMSLLCTR